MVVFNKINFLKKRADRYMLISLENKNVNVPDLVSLYKEKYTVHEIQSYKLHILQLIESRFNILKSVFSYLFGHTDFNILNLDQYMEEVSINEIVERYNKVLVKAYTGVELSTLECYLVDKYQVLDHVSFSNKELVESEDFMFAYLMSFVSDYKCYDFLYSEIIMFFNDILNEEKKRNDFFSFFFFQYEYYFFLDSLHFFLCSGLSIKRDELFIKNSVRNASLLLNFSFAKSNGGLYHSSNDISCPFVGFLELHIKDLYLLLNNPETNSFSFFSYLDNKYGDTIYPFCVSNSKEELVFYSFDNMIDFNYMEDFVNSFLRYVLNANTTRLYDTLVTIKTELE